MRVTGQITDNPTAPDRFRGALRKSGDGTLRLTGTNTYTGGTVIEAGTLVVGDGASSGSIVGDVRNEGVLTFDRGDSSVFEGDISGSGAVEKEGSGLIVLTGESTFAGDLTVNHGAVQIGDGGTRGSVTADIVLNGQNLGFARSDDVVYGGVISGTGRMAKISGGTLSLTGENTYTGGTTVGALGTIQIGNGGTSGSIQGNVLNLGTLAFNRSDRTTFAGMIRGKGGVEVRNGVVRVTGENTYAGGTTINSGAGMIVGDGATSGSITGDVVNNGILNFARSDALTFGGSISGTGSMAQAGRGTLTLTGDATHTGGTFVSGGGTLQIGDGGTTGSVRGDIGVVRGTLAFNRSDRLTYGGVISGAGNTIFRRGTVRLTGENTHTGGTTINSGAAVIVGDTAGSGSITGDVVNNGILNFQRGDRLTYAGVISGSGSVAHAGTGRLTLTGDSTYTGSTFVSNGGTLMLEGSLTSDIDVRTSAGGTGSRLGGSGSTTGTLTVQSGSSVAPGSDGIGTLRLGNFNLLSGATMEIDGLAAAGTGLASDFIAVSGTATFGEASPGAGAPHGRTIMDVTFNANTTLPDFSDIIVVAAEQGVLGRAPAVILDPASLPNGQNFYLNLDASNAVDNPGGGVGPGELIRPGRGNPGFIVLQVVKSDPVFKKPHQLTVVNGNYVVPNAQPVLAPSHVPQLVPPQIPTALPYLVPALVKGPTANVTTPVVAHKKGNKPATGIKVIDHGIQVGGTLTPQPQTQTGTQVSPGRIPVGTGNTVVVVEPPTDLVTTDFISVTGTYSKVDQRHAPTGTKYRLTYGPHRVDVFKTPGNYGRLTGLGVTQTATQQGVGNALTRLLPKPHERPGTTDLGVLVDALYPLGLGQINGFLDEVAGTDEDPTFVAVMNNRLFQDAVSARLSDRRDEVITEQGGLAAGKNLASWATIMGRYAETDAYLGGADLGTWGVALGADMDATPEIAVGAGLAYTTTSIDKNSGASDRVRNLDIGAYASWSRNDWFANGLVGFGRHWLDLDRAAATGGGAILTGKAQARSFFAGIEGGRSFKTEFATIEPMAGLRYMYLDRDGYTEGGSTALAREVSDTQLNVWQGLVGVRAYRDYKAADGTIWRPEVKIGYAHDFGDTDIDESAWLVSAPGSAFPVTTAGPGDDVGFVQFRLTGKRGATNYFADYKADIRSDFVNQSIGAGFNISF